MTEKVRAHDRFGGNGFWEAKNEDADDDRRLFLQAALAGSKVALGALIQSHWQDVFLYFQTRLDLMGRKIRSQVEAADLAQRVSKLVCEKFGDFQSQTLGKYQAWLFKIAQNEWKATLRHFAPGTKHDASLEQALDDELAASHGYGRRGHSAAEVFAKLEELDELAAAIEKLPDDQRKVVTLWRDGHKSFAAIARELDWSPDAVAKTFHRAVQALRCLVRD